MQAAFLTFVTGGSSSYGRNLNMGAAHQRLIDDMGLQMEHFDVVLELLGNSLIDLHVTQAIASSCSTNYHRHCY